MKCEYCGSEMNDYDKFCSSCGHLNTELKTKQNKYDNSEIQNQTDSPSEKYQQNNYIIYKNNDSSTLGVLALIFMIILPIVGLILTIVGFNTYKDENSQGKKCCVVAMWIFVGWICLPFIFLLLSIIFE